MAETVRVFVINQDSGKGRFVEDQTKAVLLQGDTILGAFGREFGSDIVNKGARRGLTRDQALLVFAEAVADSY